MMVFLGTEQFQDIQKLKQKTFVTQLFKEWNINYAKEASLFLKYSMAQFRLFERFLNIWLRIYFVIGVGKYAAY